MSSYFDTPSTTGGGSSYFDPPSKSKKKTKKKGRSKWVSAVHRYSGAELAGNLLEDIGEAAVGVVPGMVAVGKAVAEDVEATARDPLKPRGIARGREDSAIYRDVVAPIGKSYKDYYWDRDVLSNVYNDPLQLGLDALTLATGGAAAGAKLGLISKGRHVIETPSPRRTREGKGPVQKRVTSTKPLVRAREKAVAKLKNQDKEYGSGIRRRADRRALSNLAGYGPYINATKRLREKQWAALWVRALDTHPDDLAELWRGTAGEAIATDPAIRQLVLNPTEKLLKAEKEARLLSQQGENLLLQHGKLSDESAAGRPGLFKEQASAQLKREVRSVTGNPYYFPHVMDAPIVKDPLRTSGGGKGRPRRLGATRQNLGILSLGGKLHLRGDVLGPEFLKRVHHIKIDEIHKGLRRGSIRLTRSEIDNEFGGKLPDGYEYIRSNPYTKTVVEEHPLAGPGQVAIPGVQQPYAVTTKKVRIGEAKIPHTIRGEGDVKMTPRVTQADLEGPQGGFTTNEIGDALRTRGDDPVYFVVPKQMVKAATGEFTRSNRAVRMFVENPLKWWRAIVLGLRVGYLTNNLVGNSIMYSVRTAGRGALRDLIGAVIETHGRETAIRLLDDPATPRDVRTDLYREFFPEQLHGTFSRTQSPALDPFQLKGKDVPGSTKAKRAGQMAGDVGRATTGALPRLTHRLAEDIPRRATIRNMIRNSPEFRAAWMEMPKQSRKFENVARQLLEGEQGKQFQARISKDVDDALGNYSDLSPVERGVLRNTLPFYAWYKAITTATLHLAFDTPGRALLLDKLGEIGYDWVKEELGEVPAFLRGAIPIGGEKGGKRTVLTTGGLNPYSTIEGLIRGGTEDISQLGLNPLIFGMAEAYARTKRKEYEVSPFDILAGLTTGVGGNLPPSRLVRPPKPSELYPERGRESEFLGYLGAPIKRVDVRTARKQAREGR